MKNRILSVLVVVFVLCICMASLVACEVTHFAHIHNYATLKYDNENHWFECECKEKRNAVSHNIKNGECACGYIVPHSHEYTILKTDEAEHWYECVCGDKFGIEAHKGCTATCTELAVCSVCSVSYDKLKEHNYATLKNNETEHWFECVCGDKSGIEAHGGGTATCENKPLCSICNSEYGSASGHAVVIDIAVAPTCTATGLTEGKHCDRCKAVLVKQNITQKSEHITSDWIVDKEPELGIEGHKYKNCVQCGGERQEAVIEMLYSQGLEYVLLDDGTYGISSGEWRDGTNSFLVIPPVYEDIPVTQICDFAFYYYQPLCKLILPDSITTIGNQAFVGCLNLTEIDLPNNIQNIGMLAFWGCSFTSVSIPSSIINIGDGAFSSCVFLTNIYCGNEKYYQWGGIYLYNIQNDFICCVAGIEGEIYVPNGTTAIANRAFQGCDKLTYVYIPYTTKSIGECAFYQCTGLTKVLISENVTYIGWAAFGGCVNLTEIVFCGTMEEWNGIEKATNWDYDLYNYTIICTDGMIFAPQTNENN